MGNVSEQWDNSSRGHTDRVARYLLDWSENAGDEVFWMWVLGPTGHHAEGRAIDFMTLTANQGALRNKLGNELAAHIRKHHKALGVEYIIWRQRIWNATRDDDRSRDDWLEWRGMENRGSPTANHMDHVHLSLLSNPPAFKAPGKTSGGGKQRREKPTSWDGDVDDIRDVLRKGDTLTELADFYGVDVDAIAAHSHIRDPDQVKVGQVLWVYAPRYQGPSRSRKVDLSEAQARARDEHKTLTWQDNTTRCVKWALAEEGLLDRQHVDGRWGPRCTKAYAAWQKQLGYQGFDADGIPGKDSLTKLAKKNDLTVIE